MTHYLYFSEKEANNALGYSFEKVSPKRKPNQERRSIEEIKASSPLNYMIAVDDKGNLFQATSFTVKKQRENKLDDLELVGEFKSENQYGILVNGERKLNKAVADKFGIEGRNVSSIITKTKQSMSKNGQKFHQPSISSGSTLKVVSTRRLSAISQKC